MARTKKPVDSDTLSVRLGRTAPSATYTYDWVRLAVSNDADSLYGKLRMFLNRERDDGIVWPSKELLGMLMHVKRGDYIDKWLKELEDIGAMEKLPSDGRTRSHNEYLLHDLPPDGYDGPTSPKEFLATFGGLVKFRKEAARDKVRLQRLRDLYYLNASPPPRVAAFLRESFDIPTAPEAWAELHAAEVQRRNAEAAKREAAKAARRAKSAAGPKVPDARKPLVAAVTDENRLPVGSLPPPVTVTDGPPVTVTDHGGLEPYEGELGVSEPKPPLPPRQSRRTATRNPGIKNRGNRDPKTEAQEPEDIDPDTDRLIVELMAVMDQRPPRRLKWGELPTRDVVAKLRDRGRPLGLIRLAMLHLANGTFGFTGYPGRALVDDGPWWERALMEYRKTPEFGASVAPRGCNRCDHGWVVDAGTRLPLEPAVKCSHKAMAGVS